MGNRMALGITTILTIMFLLGSLNGNLPRVSYPKALDWYLLVSFSFVFLSLMECMVVFLFASKAKQDETQIKYKVSVRSLISAGPGRGGGGGGWRKDHMVSRGKGGEISDQSLLTGYKGRL